MLTVSSGNMFPKTYYVAWLAVLGVNVCWAKTHPNRPSCRIYWYVGYPCSLTGLLLMNQIDLWRTDANCANGGENCLYSYLDSNRTTLTATHTSPVDFYVDELVFEFLEPETVPQTSCFIRGFSYSTLEALYDSGRNYCNLQNLIIGAGLDRTNGYQTFTSDAVCSQYSEADCHTY